MKNLLLIAFLILSIFSLRAQQMEELKTEVKIVCFGSQVNEGTKVLHHGHNHDLMPFNNYRSESTQNTGATFEVTYIGFSDEARQAFQRAVDIWASYISSDVTIRVEANWRSLDNGVLGSAIWGTAYRGFEGALNNDTWYPVALAEKMAGRDLNSPDDPDLIANFNRNANWYLGLDGETSATETDLVSVVLHELGHGLGFIDSYNINEENQGTVGIQGFPFTFDLRVENNDNQALTELTNTPEDLARALRSNAIFFNSPAAVVSTGTKPKLFAPSEWNPGSSIAHLDEATYPAGDPNSLMSPQIGLNEVIQEPGQITLDMFGDMGWEYTYIENIDRPNSDDFEAETFPITLSIRSDVGYSPESVTLLYSIDGFQNDTTEVQMTPTGNPDEFTAEITSTKTEDQVYAYYVKVTDIKGRDFSRPSLAESANVFLEFSTSQDNDAPIIAHEGPNFVRIQDNTLSLTASIQDYLPVNAIIEYAVNGGATQTSSLELTNPLSNTYTSQVDLQSLNLNAGDVFSYRISATDLGQNSNNSLFPATGFIEINVAEQPVARNAYSTDFNDLTQVANDFQDSPDFSIREEAGFENGALHSSHPYENGTGPNRQSNYTIELKYPILFQSVFPVMSFDEVALIEAGDAGSEFGDNNFYDYVIVEGSKDGGSTWLPFLDGYDNRANRAWADAYNANINADNDSETDGDVSLFINREINILENGNFNVGDEVLIRFRIFADELARGWGWAIDNLKIQIDDEGPTIVHDHLDYVTSLNNLDITARVNDNAAVDSVGVLIRVNGQAQAPIGLASNDGENFSTTLDLSNLQFGDLIEYRLAAFDNNSPNANATYVPNDTDFIQVPIIQLGSPVDLYSNDFNAASDDFVGNFFSITAPQGFTDNAIHSTHPYPIGFGVLGSGSFTYTLKTPIRIDEEKALVTYDEIVLIEPVLDFTALDASKDNGETWFEIARYSTSSFPDVWAPVFENGGDGSPALYRERSIELTASPQINDGDVVLLRFRLERRGRDEGWGWSIDNLEIQTEVIASIENEQITAPIASIFPNPVDGDELFIQLKGQQRYPVNYSIYTMSGTVHESQVPLTFGPEQQALIDISKLPRGFYILTLQDQERIQTFKFLKSR